MSIKVERCVGHAAAPSHSSTHRIVSLVNKVVAFRVSSKPRSYKVHPTEGFIDVGGYALLTVTSPRHHHSAASLRIDWTETNPRERNVAAAFRFGQQSGHVIHPLNSMVVYSDEKYPSALLRAHTDPWANVRRPWAVIKFGSRTTSLRNSEIVWRAVSTIYDALCDHHVMLEEAPLYHAVTPMEREQIARESREQLSDANVKRSLFPVLLLVDDSDEEFAAYIRKKLSKHVYVFELSSQEMVDIASSSAQRPYPQLNEWCREFAQLVEETEKGMRSPTDGDKPGVSEPLTSRSNAVVDDWEEKHVPMSRAADNMEHPNATDFHEAGNDLVDFHGHGNNNLSCFNGHSADRRKIASARDIEQALMYARNNRSDENVVIDLAVPYIFNRLASPFNEIVPNIDLMQLLCIACSVRTDLKDALDCAYMITDRILSTRYIPNVCDRFGYPSIEDPRRWTEDFSAFLTAIMHVFILIDSYNFHGEEVLYAWTTYHDVLVKLPCEFWDKEEARDWLERMAAKLEHLAHYRPPRQPTPPRDDGYGRFEDDMDERGLGKFRDFRQIYFYDLKLARTSTQTARNINEVWAIAQYNVGSKSFVPATPASKTNHMAAVDNDPVKASVEVDPRRPRKTLRRTSTSSHCSCPPFEADWEDQEAKLTESQKNRCFEVSLAHLSCNVNDPLLERIATCDEKWILCDNRRRLPSG